MHQSTKMRKMGKSFLRTLALTTVIISVISCSKNDSSDSSFTAGSITTTTTSNTSVKLTASTSANVLKPNYIIMMFDQPVTSSTALPPIKKQVITDANGVANFDLTSIVTGTTATKYYFEAFVETPTGYTWKSVSHPSYDISKGQVITSSIIVN